jgi:hypothetical protein
LFLVGFDCFSLRADCFQLFFFFSFGSYVVSGWISSIGSGGGVVAMVQPIQAPMPRTAIKAIATGMVTSQSLSGFRVGWRRAKVYAVAMVMQAMQISQPIPWSLPTIYFTFE